MKLQDQILDIRYAVSDIDGNIYSNYQIVNALNTVIRQVNAALSNGTSDLTKKRTSLTLTDGAVDLPSDYQSIIKITDSFGVPLLPRTTEADTDKYTYEILDNQIIANQPTVILTYKKYFSEIDANDLTIDMPLPDFLKDVLTQYTKVMLQGAVSQGDSTVLPPIEQKVMQLVASRRGKPYTKMPFRV